MKLSVVSKISLSGLILALVIIFTRFLSIQNIPVLPFVRISIGPALIIFASILLGPIYGGVVGGASDILGILLVPNAQGYSINPWFTLIYTILGILPWCIYKLFTLIKNDKISFICFNAFLLCIWVFVLLNGLLNPLIDNYDFELYQKVLIFSVSFILMAAASISIYFINRYFINKNQEINVSVMKIAMVALISETLVMLVGNTIVKSIFFEVDFLVILFFQAIIFFIDIPLNTFVVTYLLKLANKVLLKNNS